MFHSKKNCGLPIGNLTSQLFGNIYLNDFDHFVKRDLNIRYYGRYVDDFVLIHQDKEYLKSVIPIIKEFLSDKLKLELHPGKIYLQHFSKGVKYLGAVLKPHRIYIANRTKGNFYEAIKQHNELARDHRPSAEEKEKFLSSMNSYLGIMKPCKASLQGKYYRSYKIRKKLIKEKLSGLWFNYFYPSRGYTKFVKKCKSTSNRTYNKLQVCHILATPE